jgi:2'-5' RNA ligase
VSNLVIVAIPDENDRAWKVSSEKVPHMTLLYLGDPDQVANLESIVQFVEHAANTSLRRFYMTVDKRGELGDDPQLGPADVLFFKKGRYDYKAIRDFRAQLLQDNNIRTAYDSVQQFDAPWIPHLTLGYKNRPAKPDDSDYPFYDVSFNRIAVWTADFDGPAFDLKDYWDEFDALETVPMDVAMSALIRRPAVYEDPEMNHAANVGAAFLAHYGVKGMRWGVRNDKGGTNTSGVGEKKREGLQGFLDPQGHALDKDVVKTLAGVIVPIIAPLTWPAQIRMYRGGFRGAKAKLLDHQEKKFAKHAMSPKNFAAIHNGSVESFNRGVSEINKRYTAADLQKPAKQKAYDDEVLKLQQDTYRASANSLVNKANTMHLDVEYKNDGRDFVIHAQQGPGTPLPERVKHAATEEELANEPITVEISGKIKRDSSGYITGFDFDDLDSATAAHSADIGATLVAEILSAESLEHYGVKGMRWGVRRDRGTPLAVGPSASSRVPHGDRRKTKIKTEGGQNHPAHEDAIKVAEAKVKLRKSGVAALSNKELKDVRERVQLEEQVKGLMTSRGRKFVRQNLQNESTNLARTGARAGIRKAAKRGGRVGATAALFA